MALCGKSIFRHSAVDEHAQLVQGALPTAEFGDWREETIAGSSPFPWSAMAGSSPFPWFCTEPGFEPESSPIYRALRDSNPVWYCTAPGYRTGIRTRCLGPLGSTPPVASRFCAHKEAVRRSAAVPYLGP